MEHEKRLSNKFPAIPQSQPKPAQSYHKNNQSFLVKGYARNDIT